MAKHILPLDTPDLTQKLTPELLGSAVKARRTQNSLRLEDAAALCGVAKQTLMQVERGHNTKLETLLQICSGLGITLRIMPWEKMSDAENDWE